MTADETNDADPSAESFLLIPELDPLHEAHPYIRAYKEARFGKWRPTVKFLQELSALQVFLLSLGRTTDVISITAATRPFIAENDDWDSREGYAKSWAREIFREEVLSLGAHAAGLEQKEGAVTDFLRGWGSEAFGWRCRVRPRDLAQWYRVVGSRKDEVIGSADQLGGENATKRLLAACRRWMWLLTDHLIWRYDLPGIQVLTQAEITEVMIITRVALHPPAVARLLELKRRECLLHSTTD